MAIADRLVGSTQAVRIDIALHNRIDIVIQNMSDVVVWIDTQSGVRAAAVAGQLGVGYPLAPNAVANGYNGGFFGLACRENVQFWAIAQAGANNELVVIEAAR